MEFLNFNGIFQNLNEKYTFYQKLFQTKFVELIEAINCALLRFFPISHILVKNLNTRLSIVSFWKKKIKIYIL